MEHGDLVEAMARGIAAADANPDAGLRDLWHVEGYRATVIKLAQAALAAIEAQGLAVVPVEPTPEMIEATRTMEMPRADSANAMVSAMIVGTWSAMLAASPLRGEG
jgi:hypothetical protein